MFISSPAEFFGKETKFFVRAFGPLRVTTAGSTDVTPTATKSQALLAILLIANGEPVQRTKLQSLLWSDRMQAQGRESLKQALMDLRRTFGEHRDTILVSKRGTVRLAMEHLETDLYGGLVSNELIQPEFLEGIDVRDAEFEDWLRQVRAQLANRKLPASVSNLVQAPGPGHIRMKLLFVETQTADTDQRAKISAELFVQRVVEAFLEEELFEVIASCDNQAATIDADIVVSTSSMSYQNEVVTRFVAHQMASNKLIWSHEERMELADLAGPPGRIRARQLCDMLLPHCLREVERASPELLHATRLMMTGIDQLFRVAESNLELAEAAFDEALDIEERGTFLAWRAYLNAFKYEKSFGDRKSVNWEKTDELARKALELDRYNPLVAALLSHVYSFVARDNHRAAELLDTFRSGPSSSLMLNDSLALFHYYTGDYEKARKHAKLTSQLGKFSPYKFAFTTTEAMIALVEGELATAQKYAEKARRQQGLTTDVTFEPTLRVLAAAAGHAGDKEVAKLAVRQIHKQDPAFSLRAFDSPSTTPIPNQDAFHVIKTGLEKANEYSTE